jgi:IPT/TIG domain
VQATDSSGRLKPYTEFTVPPTFSITPTTGTSGTTITLNGTNLGANYYYGIEWIDPVSGTLTNMGNVSADNQGNVSISITAPANLVKGRSYTIALIGGSSGSPVQAIFKAS